MPRAAAILLQLPLLLLSPILICVCAGALALTDLLWKLFGRRRLNPETRSQPYFGFSRHSELERPRSAREVSAVRGDGAGGHPETRSSSSTTAPRMAAPSLSREHFPQVEVLALPKNLGFGGGSNAGFRAAKNDIVVLLNSDMRVEPDFLRRCSKASRIERSSRSPARFFSAIRTSSARRPDSRKAGGRTARCACAIASTTQSTTSSLLLRRRRIVRFRPREVSGTRRLRSAARAVLPGRHGPRLHGVEARLEGAVPAAQRGVSTSIAARSARSFSDDYIRPC